MTNPFQPPIPSKERAPRFGVSPKGSCNYCNAVAALETLQRRDGICRRCEKRPKTLRSTAFTVLIFLLIWLVAWGFLAAELAHAERSGATVRLNAFVAGFYRKAGLAGIHAAGSIVALAFGVALVLAIRAWRRVVGGIREAKRLPLSDLQ